MLSAECTHVKIQRSVQNVLDAHVKTPRLRETKIHARNQRYPYGYHRRFHSARLERQ